MGSTTSQYMNLIIPTVSNEPGPTYAQDINGDLTTIDQHDHSSGKGTPVTPAGLSINADLSFGSNNATALRSSRYTVQGTPLSAGTDLGCSYVSGVDLYYNDVNGTQIRLTQSGAVAGTPGSIGNLLAPANVTYNAGTQTFVFQSTTATAGNIDAGSILIRELVASANSVTLASPVSLANSYTLTLPAALPSTSLSNPIFVTTNSSGNLAVSTGVDNFTLASSGSSILVKDKGITQQKIALRPAIGTIGGVVFSGNSGSFTTNSTTFTPVTNCSLTITTFGNPVRVSLQPTATSGAPAFIGCDAGGVSVVTAFFIVARDGNGFHGPVELNSFTSSNTAVIPGLPELIDVVPAGTYLYALNTLVTNSSGTASVRNFRLCAYEIK